MQSVTSPVLAKASNAVMVNVRGKRRKVFLEAQLGPSKWRARIRMSGDYASIRGIFQVYSNGAKRFTPTGSNGKYL